MHANITEIPSTSADSPNSPPPSSNGSHVSDLSNISLLSDDSAQPNLPEGSQHSNGHIKIDDTPIQAKKTMCSQECQEIIKWLVSAGLGGVVCLFYFDGTATARRDDPAIGWQLTIGGSVVNGIPTAFFSKEGIDFTLGTIKDPEISTTRKVISIPLITVLAILASVPYAVNEYGFIENNTNNSNNTTALSNSTSSADTTLIATTDAALVGLGNFPLNFYGLSNLILNQIPNFFSHMWYGGLHKISGNRWYQEQHDIFILRDIVVNHLRAAKKPIIRNKLKLDSSAANPESLDPIVLLLNQIAGQSENINAIFQGNSATLPTCKQKTRSYAYRLVRAGFGSAGAAATIMSTLSLECDVTQTFQDDLHTEGGTPSWSAATATMVPLYWLCIEGGYGTLGDLCDIHADLINGEFEAPMAFQVAKFLMGAYALLGAYFAALSWGTSVGLLPECPPGINNNAILSTTYVGTPLFNFIYYMKAGKKWVENYKAVRGTPEQQQALKTLSAWDQQCSRLEKISDEKLISIAQAIREQQPKIWEQITNHLPREKQEALQRLELVNEADLMEAQKQPNSAANEDAPPRKSCCEWLTGRMAFWRSGSAEGAPLLPKAASSAQLSDKPAEPQESCWEKFVSCLCPG